MRLATVRRGATTHAVRVDGEHAIDLDLSDVGALLARPDWRDYAAGHDGQRFASDELDFAPVIPSPEKIICVGLNYRTHITEMGRGAARRPTLFAKYPRAIIGAHDEDRAPADLRCGRLGGRARCRDRPSRAARYARAGALCDRRLHRRQRRHCSRLAVPHDPVDAGQELRGHHADRSASGRPTRTKPDSD